MSVMERTTQNIPKVDYNLSKHVLNMMMLYVISANKAIRRSHLMNLARLMSTYDPKAYEKDYEKKEMVEFIMKGLDARIHMNLTDPQTILYQIRGHITDVEADRIDKYAELTTSEVQWLNQMVSNTIDQAFIFGDVDHMIDICTRFKTTTDITEKARIVDEYKEQVVKSQNEFRRNKNEADEDEMFSLESGVFETRIQETYAEVTNPSRKLMLGNQALNELFGGGLEEGRVYTIFGLPGEGKSMTLLNMAYMIKQYNRSFKTKDPTKKPCVVILTMENRIAESICRLFNMSIHKHSNISEFSVNEVMKLMRENGRLELNDNNPIDIIIKYKASNSCDTSYLYTLVEDLEDEGKECICFIQDYVGRIRSTERFTDTRLEYGKVIDEFKTFAANKNIPVLTASQLNRDASKHIDEGRQKNKADLVRILGRSNISESMLILNNTDGGFVLAPESTPTGEMYMGIQRIKKRYEASNQECFYIPYYRGTMTMIEDIGKEPVSKITLKETAYDDSANQLTRFSSTSVNEIHDDISYIDGTNKDFKFSSSAIVSSETVNKDEEDKEDNEKKNDNKPIEEKKSTEDSNVIIIEEIKDEAPIVELFEPIIIAMQQMEQWNLMYANLFQEMHAPRQDGLYCPIVMVPFE